MNDRHQFILAILVVLGVVTYGVFQWSERTALILEADSLATQANNLTSESKKLTENYQTIKAEVTADRETAAQELALVFPTNEDLTTLTRLFDTFEGVNNFDTNPFFISGITYDAAKTSEDGSYRYVPVSMSLTSSKKNLSEFLEYIETSGSLEGEVRLMSVEDMSITYPEEFGGTYEARVTVDAYFSQEL